ncbi:hypothetical protein SAMN04487948_11438 [Halogranum amylolyticum]|uniref:Transposase DDE domain-containing protein n=1 Tax=Halogranum amylolyticum TaxID=660520 RepID=A0A1H8V6F8_9EURY|nr:transposase [Halogranum amylolyticum]SEP10348.1 hypothetical protein SAMN04487948_11438 [Halogranum amylolyticum]
MESEKKSKLYKEEPDDPKDKWIAFYTNIGWIADDADEESDLESLTEEQREMPLTPLELADDFRARWGIETGYRKLKEDFLAKSRSARYYIRVQVFYFAVLWYNMWLAANVKGAGEVGTDLGDDDENYLFRGPEVMRAIEAPHRHHPESVVAESEGWPAGVHAGSGPAQRRYRNAVSRDLLAGVGFALLEVAYLSIPNSIYHFGLDSLRDTQSKSPEPSNAMMWLYRFIGVCLVVMSILYYSNVLRLPHPLHVAPPFQPIVSANLSDRLARSIQHDR